MNIEIRPAKETDLPAYTKLLQHTYVATYVNEKLGLIQKCFSKEIFENEETQKYLLSNLKTDENQKAYIAIKDNELIGSITVKKLTNAFEITGFYVAPELQGKGIGKQLWQKALEWIGDKDIVLDLYVHSVKTLAMYKKWGFKVDETRGDNGYFYRHWEEWPEDLKAKCVYMRLTQHYI